MTKKEILITILIILIFLFSTIMIINFRKSPDTNNTNYNKEILKETIKQKEVKLDTLNDEKKENDIVYQKRKETLLNDTILNQNTSIMEYIQISDKTIENLKDINDIKSDIIKIKDEYIEILEEENKDLKKENKKLRLKIKLIGVGVITTAVAVIILK